MAKEIKSCNNCLWDHLWRWFLPILSICSPTFFIFQSCWYGSSQNEESPTSWSHQFSFLLAQVLATQCIPHFQLALLLTDNNALFLSFQLSRTSWHLRAGDSFACFFVAALENPVSKGKLNCYLTNDPLTYSKSDFHHIQEESCNSS